MLENTGIGWKKSIFLRTFRVYLKKRKSVTKNKKKHANKGMEYFASIRKRSGVLPNQIYFYLIFHGTVYTYYDI